MDAAAAVGLPVALKPLWTPGPRAVDQMSRLGLARPAEVARAWAELTIDVLVRPLEALFERHARRVADELRRAPVVGEEDHDLARARADSRLVGLEFGLLARDLEDEPREIAHGESRGRCRR